MSPPQRVGPTLRNVCSWCIFKWDFSLRMLEISWIGDANIGVMTNFLRDKGWVTNFLLKCRKLTIPTKTNLVSHWSTFHPHQSARLLRSPVPAERREPALLPGRQRGRSLHGLEKTELFVKPTPRDEAAFVATEESLVVVLLYFCERKSELCQLVHGRPWWTSAALHHSTSLQPRETNYPGRLCSCLASN